MLAGVVDRYSDKIPALQARAEELRAEISRLEAKAVQLQRQRESTRARLAALDTTMGLIDSRVRPDAAGVVHAWAGKYGERGALKKFVISTLQAAAPGGLDRRALALAANVCFGLGLEDEVSLARFIKNSLRSILHNLKVEGVLRHDRPVLGPVHGRWCWKGEELPSLDEMLRLANAADADGTDGLI